MVCIMNHKSFLYLSLTVSLLTTAPCYAMEGREEDKGSPPPAHQLQTPSLKNLSLDEANQQVRIATALSHIQAEFIRLHSMPQTLQKAEGLNKIIKSLQPYADEDIPKCIGSQKLPMYFLLETLSAAYFMRGEILCEQTEDRINCLSQASECLEQTFQIYQKHNLYNPEATLGAAEKFANTLFLLGNAYMDQANQETDSGKKIATYLQGLTSLKRSCKTVENMDRLTESLQKMQTTMKAVSDIYLDLLSSVETLQEPNLVKRLQFLSKATNLSKDILAFHEQCSITFFFPENLEKDYSDHPEELISLVAATYCGVAMKQVYALLELSLRIPDHADNCIKKSREQTELAISVYKEKIYKNEYADDPKKESDFIVARLDSYMGNDELIKEFYCNLRKERQRQTVVRRIAEAKEMKRQQEEKERQLTEENALRKERMRQKKLEAQTTTTTTTTNSSDSQAFENHIEEPYKIQERPLKEKTRFIGPMLPLAQPVLQTEKEGTHVKQTITLKPKHHYVFQCLTGEISNRHITLGKVLKLLEKLDCTFDTAGGSHNKVIAPNNHEWTIPPAWSGPIPSLYHGELMDFLLEKMDLNPDEVISS